MDGDIVALCDKLYQEYLLIHLIYHRNKNQHRASIWWRQFNELKRTVSQVLKQLRKHKPSDKDGITLFSLLKRLRNQQVSKMYYGFNGVIALGQFVTLGVVLVGLLARVYGIFTEISKLKEERFVKLGCVFHDPRRIESSTQLRLQNINGEEIGEEVTEGYLNKFNEVKSFERTNPVKTTGSKVKKKAKKGKKKRSVIDDIFG
ncbi:LAFE_0H07382g1_1 [Lachancea fermentati]|uniref:LAFE_0H07382g1_1 n=1 Tax=Lachancea fermentati TaxID=4955 RepID=A0A1G4MK99_LACFM|nr:LAFE_0H07382g1_1 [Lachancea fermentati]